MSKTAIILSGGGITGGIYELGALAALDDLIAGGKKPTDFDIYIGISAGSILAAMLANGITPKLMYRSVLGPAENPFYLRQEDIYSFPFREYLKGLFKYIRSLPKIFKSMKNDQRKVTFVNLLSALESCIPPGIYSNRNLESYMERVLSLPGNTGDFEKLYRELYIVAIELDRGERWIFGEEGKRDVPIPTAIRASSAIPGYFSPVQIKGQFFIDGAAERSGHIDIAITHGADLIIIINPVVPVYNDKTVVSIPTFTGCCRSIAESGISNVTEQSFRINSRVKLDLGLTIIKNAYPEVDIMLIEPGQLESALFLYGSMNYSERIQILNYGYNSASVFFMEHFKKVADCFMKHEFEVSLDNLKIDKFLYYTTKMKTRKRFSLNM